MTTCPPHSDKAILDIRRLEDYCLSPSHPRGQHKARAFREALDLQSGDAAWLRNVLLVEASRIGDLSPVTTESWGSHWLLDSTIERHGKVATVLAIWIVRIGENVPRFLTCWVL